MISDSISTGRSPYNIRSIHIFGIFFMSCRRLEILDWPNSFASVSWFCILHKTSSIQYYYNFSATFLCLPFLLKLVSVKAFVSYQWVSVTVFSNEYFWSSKHYISLQLCAMHIYRLQDSGWHYNKSRLPDWDKTQGHWEKIMRKTGSNYMSQE